MNTTLKKAIYGSIFASCIVAPGVFAGLDADNKVKKVVPPDTQYECIDGVTHYKHKSMNDFAPMIHHIQQSIVLCKIENNQFLVRPYQRATMKKIPLSMYLYLRSQFIKDWFKEDRSEKGASQ